MMLKPLRPLYAEGLWEIAVTMKTEVVINAMNWTGMVLNLIGFVLNTRKSIWGYFMWIISGPLLFCVMWHEGLLPQMILLSFYLALTFFGIYNWSKEG
jgi:nicotinamide riboside transporter PnuC